MTATNPFTQIKTTIETYVGAHWDSLPADNPAKVKVGNRWSTTQRKGALAPNDTPAVSLRPVDGGDTNPLATSSSGHFSRQYELGIVTDGITPEDSTLDQCEWELIRVAAKASKELLGLTDLVLKVTVSGTRQTNQDLEAGRQRRRWTGAVTITVFFQVSKTSILP